MNEIVSQFFLGLMLRLVVSLPPPLSNTVFVLATFLFILTLLGSSVHHCWRDALWNTPAILLLLWFPGFFRVRTALFPCPRRAFSENSKGRKCSQDRGWVTVEGKLAVSPQSLTWNSVPNLFCNSHSVLPADKNRIIYFILWFKINKSNLFKVTNNMLSYVRVIQQTRGRNSINSNFWVRRYEPCVRGTVY